MKKIEHGRYELNMKINDTVEFVPWLRIYAGYIKVIDKNNQFFEDYILNKCTDDDNLGLLYEREGQFFTNFNSSRRNPLPVRLTNIEKAWLKALINQNEIRLTLKEDTYNKLQKVLEDFDSPIKDEYFEMTNKTNLPEILDKDKREENFKILLDALVKEKPIRYNNTDRNGIVYENMLAMPVAIEYSMRDSRFRLSMYSIDSDRPIMENIHTLFNIRIVSEKVSIDREKARQFLSDNKKAE